MTYIIDISEISVISEKTVDGKAGGTLSDPVSKTVSCAFSNC